MKAVTSDRMGLETIRHGTCSEHPSRVPLGPSWGRLVRRQALCPPGPTVQSAQQIVSDGRGCEAAPPGLGPTGQSTAGLQRACLQSLMVDSPAQTG